MPVDPERDLQGREFMRLLAEHERRLTAYVHALIPLWQDAEDVLQDTRTRLWEQFDSFRLDADFGVWARTIAHYMVLTYRTHCRRDRLCFSDDVLEKISQNTSPAVFSDCDSHMSALMECVKSLNVASRKLLHRLCTERQRIKDIARDLEQTPTAVRVAFHRIRRSLAKCVEKRLQEEERR